MFDLKLDCGTTINVLYMPIKCTGQYPGKRQENPKMIPQVYLSYNHETTFNARIQIEAIGKNERKTISYHQVNTATTGHKLQGATLAALWWMDGTMKRTGHMLYYIKGTNNDGTFYIRAFMFGHEAMHS
jgi:hypothetical protein